MIKLIVSIALILSCNLAFAEPVSKLETIFDWDNTITGNVVIKWRDNYEETYLVSDRSMSDVDCWPISRRGDTLILRHVTQGHRMMETVIIGWQFCADYDYEKHKCKIIKEGK